MTPSLKWKDGFSLRSSGVLNLQTKGMFHVLVLYRYQWKIKMYTTQTSPIAVRIAATRRYGGVIYA
jgi:hypothetical protein